MRHAEGNQQAMIQAHQLTQMRQALIAHLFSARLGAADDGTRALRDAADGVQHAVRDVGMALAQPGHVGHLGRGAARLPGVDEQQRQRREAQERLDAGRLAVVGALEDDRFALGADGVVDAGWVAVDAAFAHEGPAVDALELQRGFGRRLVRVRPAEGVGLEEERGCEADADGGRGAEPRAERDGGAECVDAGEAARAAEAEEEVEELGGGVAVDFPFVGFGGGADGVDVRFEGGEEFVVEGGDKVVVVSFLGRVVEGRPGQIGYGPGVAERDVGEEERDGTGGFGESVDVEVGA